MFGTAESQATVADTFTLVGSNTVSSSAPSQGIAYNTIINSGTLITTSVGSYLTDLSNGINYLMTVLLPLCTVISGNLIPGIYCAPDATDMRQIILDAQGSTGALFIFYGLSLNVDAGPGPTLFINSATQCNFYVGAETLTINGPANGKYFSPGNINLGPVSFVDQEGVYSLGTFTMESAIVNRIYNSCDPTPPL